MTRSQLHRFGSVECEHGYRLAGGSFDCPACEAERREAARTAWERHQTPTYEPSPFPMWAGDE